jgi:hypothetical protein
MFDKTIATDISKNPVAIDRRTIADSIILQDKYQTFLNIYDELKLILKNF